MIPNPYRQTQRTLAQIQSTRDAEAEILIRITRRLEAAQAAGDRGGDAWLVLGDQDAHGADRRSHR